MLRARDRGINETRSPAINIKVLGDETGPQINIQSPTERLFERQKTKLQVSLQDDTAVASYEVRLLDDQGRDEPVAKAEGLSTPQVSVPAAGANDLLDIERYRPQAERPDPGGQGQGPAGQREPGDPPPAGPA